MPHLDFVLAGHAIANGGGGRVGRGQVEGGVASALLGATRRLKGPGGERQEFKNV